MGEDTKLNDGVNTIKSLSSSSLSSQPVKTNRNILFLTIQAAAVFFTIAFVWFVRLLPLLYDFVGREWGAFISLSYEHVEAFQEDFDLSNPAVIRDFALIGSISHTVVFVFGFICAKVLGRLVFSYFKGRTIVESQTYIKKNSENAQPEDEQQPEKKLERSESEPGNLNEKSIENTNEVEPIGVGATLFLVFWSAAGFHAFAWRLLKVAFETKFGPVFQFANLFFHEDGLSPFAWASSISYTVALLLGFLISIEEHHTRFQNVVLFGSETLKQYVAHILVLFVAWIWTLDRVTLPMFNALYDYEVPDGRKDNQTNEAVLLMKKESHAFAFLIGLLICSLAPTIHAFLSASSDRLVASIQTFILSSTLAWVLLTFSTHKDEMDDAISILPNFLLQITFNIKTFVLLVTLTIIHPTIAAISNGKFVLKVINFNKAMHDIMMYSTIFGFWQCYLVVFFGSAIPFQILSFFYKYKFVSFLETSAYQTYSYYDALFDWLLFVAFGAYLFPVVFHGTVKVVSVRLKSPWGWKQETIMATVCIVPLGLLLLDQSVNQKPGLVIFWAETGLHVLYLLNTWTGRPEYSGKRESAAFVEFLRPFLNLIEEYFDFKIILWSKDFKPKNKDDRPFQLKPNTARIVGFHPHGLYPCSVIWCPVSNSFQATFGKDLKMHPMTDGFTHVTPAMRDLCQFVGGREIYKPVLDKMLKEKRSLLLVPGGQNEIALHTRENMNKKLIRLYSKHTGFIRLALRHDAEIVPSFNYGELHAMENVYLPRIHKFTRWCIGFPMPFLPVGIGGILPIPKRVKMRQVFGPPIKYTCKRKFHPTEEEIEKVRVIYFQHLKDLFEATKNDCGYEDFEIDFVGLEILNNEAANARR